MKGDTWGSGNTTRVNGQLPRDVWVISGTSEQVMSVLDFCEKSRVHLVPDVSNEQRGFISHGPKGPTSQGPLMGQKALPHKDQKALSLRGAQVQMLL